jgi:hypothetical protein
VHIGIDIDLSGVLPAAVQPLPVYHPREIVHDGKRYVLREPLECVVSHGTNGFYNIDYEPFEIWSGGYGMAEAISDFSYQFADTYEYFNRLGHDGLGTLYQKVLQLMNDQIMEVR